MLLGFTRSGDFIGHDDDFDFGYISDKRDKSDVVAEAAAIIEALVDKGWPVEMETFGQFRIWVPAGDKKFKFEIFVGWREAPDAACLYFAIDKPAALDVFLPRRELLFHGVPLPIPNRPEVLCELIYGPDWRTPDSGFRYALDEKWDRLSFLFASRNRQHWNTYYQRRSESEPWSILPSQFAAFVANETSPGRLLEVGCGNGRDSLFFSSVGFQVTAADYALKAVELCQSRAEQTGLRLEVLQLNVYDLPQLMRAAGKFPAAFDVVYARFFLHAVTKIGERNFWRFCAAVLKKNGKCFVEFRTEHDRRAEAGAKLSDNERADGHYRRFVSIQDVKEEASKHQLVTTFEAAGTGMAAFRGEDPHVGRLVLTKC